MEELDNKTIMCSVLFLDIVEYSKKSVSGQISLKDRFNSYLSAAISDVPITDRIILDTGDGAAINFLGDVEDALKAALSLRESLLNEDVNVSHPLLVRMGINLGPVRLVRDINGQPNIVGDGINVAQRVMGFADAAQILVSRSYYDAVSRLSPHYAGMFHYQGSRTDKHVREHEVYAIGYPGDKTTQRRKSLTVFAEDTENSFLGRAKSSWRVLALNLDAFLEHPVDSFRQAELKLRALYVGVIVVPLALMMTLIVNQVRHEEIAAVKVSIEESATDKQQLGQTGAPASVESAVAEPATKDQVAEQPKEEQKPKSQKIATPKKYKKIKRSKSVTMSKVNPNTKSAGTFISVKCNGAEVFVDGARKARASLSPLSIEVSPGKHALIINHANGVYAQDLIFDAGKTVHLSPSFCNQ